MSAARAKAAERETVLVADDESGIRDVFVEMISDLGYRVVTAANSDEATELVRSEPVRMAFVDNWMPPGINGIEAIKRWREDGLLSFPAVVVTGFAKIESAAEAMKSGAFDVLSKPIKREMVEDLLNKVKAKAETEIFDPVLRELDLGRGASITKLKGELMRAAAKPVPAATVGGPCDGCEYFAMLLHPTGKPWVSLGDAHLLEFNPASRLSDARHGTLFIRGVGGMNRVQQRGVELMVRNSASGDVRIVCELSAPVAELAESGALSDELAEMLSPTQVSVPPVADYESDLDKVFAELARRLAEADGMGERRFSKEALKKLLSDTSKWASVGLEGLMTIARFLLRSAEGGEVNGASVDNLFSTGVAKGLVAVEASVFESSLRESRVMFEKIYFERLLERVNFNYIDAANEAGIERTYLYRKVKTVLGRDPVKEGKE